MVLRFEKGPLGTVAVSDGACWGPQTARATPHLAIGQDLMPLALIHALGQVKKAAALVNGELGLLDTSLVPFIVQAADEVIAGKRDDRFPLHVWQSGSGTQTNRNVNEVIAQRANELAERDLDSSKAIHPHDHVNLSHSPNDVFPTAMHLATALQLRQGLIPVLERLRDAITAKARAFASVVKVGRAHLQDAAPLTVGQEMSGWASLLERNGARLRQALDGLYDLALGGTEVGTGWNSHPEFAPRAAARLTELTGLPFRSHPNKFAALSAHDELAAVSAALRILAGSLLKIANDVRWLASGPRCGLGELRLPEGEPGSPLMPGKVDPTQCEALSMVALQVYGNDTAVALAASQGNLELNAYKPLIIVNVLNSLRLLQDGCQRFLLDCIDGLDVDPERIQAQLDNSLVLVTALVPRLGSGKAAQVAQAASHEGVSLREVCTRWGLLTGDEFDALVQPRMMTHPRE